MKKFDIIIIGSGLGGLLCGYILSKEGYNVCIVEKNKQLGGCLQTFKRNGCVFDIGIHYIGSMEEGQILHRYFKYFDLVGKLKLKKLDENGYDTICFINDEEVEYKYAMGEDNFCYILGESFPDEHLSLKNFYRNINNVIQSFPLNQLRLPYSEDREIEYFSVNAYDFLLKNISNDKLRKVLAGNCMNYAGVKEKTPLNIFCNINHFFMNSAWRLVDGGSQIADHLSRSIKDFQGTIEVNKEVTRFLFQGGKLTGVELKNGEQLFSKYIISDIHPASVFKMIDPGILRTSYTHRINDLEETLSSFSVFVVFKKDAFHYINSNYFIHYSNDPWLNVLYKENEWPQSIFFSTPANSGSEEFAENAILIAPMAYSDVLKWEKTTTGDRGEDYLNFKQKKAELLLGLIERKFPGFKEKISHYYTATPLTYRDYTGTRMGSMYGIMRDSNQAMNSMILPRTKIPNLFLTGQNILVHGVLGVTIASVITCSELLGLKYLVNKINHA